MAHSLRRVSSAGEWASLHAIRRAVLFPPGRGRSRYDDSHRDDRAEGNIPFLFLHDEHPIGVLRLDLRGPVGIVRLVAIVAEQQGKGHGRALAVLLDHEARRHGIVMLRVNAAPDAVGFYERTGWRRETWDREELVGIAEGCVQMTKSLRKA